MGLDVAVAAKANERRYPRRKPSGQTAHILVGTAHLVMSST